MKLFSVSQPIILCLAVWAAPAHAGLDSYYLKIAGINGESREVNHLNWIQAAGWSWQVTHAAGSGAAAVVSDFSWSQGIDSSTVPLFLGVANGTHYPTATLDVVKPGGLAQIFFEMVFTDAQLTRLSIDGNGTLPAANVAMASTDITMKYWPQLPDGTLGAPIIGNWHLGAGAPLAFEGDINVLTGLFLAGGTLNVGALPVPEPSGSALLLAGLGWLGLWARRTATASRRCHGLAAAQPAALPAAPSR